MFLNSQKTLALYCFNIYILLIQMYLIPTI